MSSTYEICGPESWTEAYCGPIRDSLMGSYVDNGRVARCGGRGVERLAEEFCPPDVFYETEVYRNKLRQDLATTSYFESHDQFQIHSLNALWPRSLRGKTVADIGCVGGSFLDHIAGVAERIIAIEPSAVYHDSLTERGYKVYPYAQDAARVVPGDTDVAVCLQVIEHTRNQRLFLEEIRGLLAADAVLLISTPKRRDILLEILPREFSAFFHRVVHRWYFDTESLAACARYAGYRVVSTQFTHRYGMSNTLAWLRDKKPMDHQRPPGIEAMADDGWRLYLEATGRSDCLYMLLAPRPDGNPS